ncbi:hypothetical protein EVAR_4701_1 [Eumeta japonica]|uniref:Reverse transcriptase domain-containing protein n=1 Tax=Eumeta variegata TaxID=151549 RepID=A0A4C1WLX8_EUMVA|nr:hypothetical protein EVAR_4701_1 [Eumeta japonica]
MNEFSIKCLPYADGQVVFAPSVCELQAMVTKMNYFVEKEVGMKANVSKTEIMVSERSCEECIKNNIDHPLDVGHSNSMKALARRRASAEVPSRYRGLSNFI